MSVKEVIKNSVYSLLSGNQEINSQVILELFLASIFLGVYIFLVYRSQQKSAFYSKDLNITIAGLPVIVCAIMIAMQNNILVSLGMVGALSIVRFRNAVKNPLDLLYFFWAVSVGIICGVNLLSVALLLCAFMTLLILMLSNFPAGKSKSILVIRTERNDVEWRDVLTLLKKHAKDVKEKSRSYQIKEIEIIYELTVKEEDNCLKELHSKYSFEQVFFLSHEGEFRV